MAWENEQKLCRVTSLLVKVDDIDSYKSDTLFNFSIAFILSRQPLYSKPNNVCRELHEEKHTAKFLIVLIILVD